MVVLLFVFLGGTICPPLSSVNDIFDATAEDKEDTELGTKGFVKRKKQAEQAKADYQRGKDARDVRDKTLAYGEIDLRYVIGGV